MKDNKPIIKKLKDYVEKTEYWKYEDGLVLGSDEAQTILSALEENEKMKKTLERIVVLCCSPATTENQHQIGKVAEETLKKKGE